MASKPIHINSLLQGAHAEGELSAQGLQTLTVNADIGAQIQAGLGVAPDDLRWVIGPGQGPDGGPREVYRNERRVPTAAVR